MRFVHTSDWHLGRTLHGVDLLGAQAQVLGQLTEWVAEPPDGVPVDAVLIAGDVYDRAVPPVEAVTLLGTVLTDLTRHCSVILTAGNHDSAIRLGFGSRLYTARLQVRTDPAEIGAPVEVGDALVYPLPFLDPDVARVALRRSDDLLDRSHQAVLAAAMDRIRSDLATRGAGRPSVVMAHAFVLGGAATESERSIAVGGVDHVVASAFEGVDYVALGHLHGAQQPSGGPNLRYSGSPLRYSFSERGQRKSFTVVDLADGEPPSLTVVPFRQPRAMADLSGALDELLSDPRYDVDAESWARITVTDRARPDRMFDRLRSRFPHALQVFHVPAGSLARNAVDLTTSPSQRSPREIGADFIAHVSRVEANDDELALFEAAMHEAALQVGRTV
jgi:exonuclease SbcD